MRGYTALSQHLKFHLSVVLLCFSAVIGRISVNGSDGVILVADFAVFT